MAAINPAIAAAVVKSNIVVISLACTNAAPKIAGIDNKKLNRADNSLSKPKYSPVEIVAPERDIPGAMEQAWATPINRELLMDISFRLVFLVTLRDTISEE